MAVWVVPITATLTCWVVIVNAFRCDPANVLISALSGCGAAMLYYSYKYRMARGGGRRNEVPHGDLPQSLWAAVGVGSTSSHPCAARPTHRGGKGQGLPGPRHPAEDAGSASKFLPPRTFGSTRLSASRMPLIERATQRSDNPSSASWTRPSRRATTLAGGQNGLDDADDEMIALDGFDTVPGPGVVATGESLDEADDDVIGPSFLPATGPLPVEDGAGRVYWPPMSGRPAAAAVMANATTTLQSDRSPLESAAAAGSATTTADATTATAAAIVNEAATHQAAHEESQVLVPDGTLTYMRGSPPNPSKPIMVFVPGLDFTGMTVRMQEEELGKDYELWVMSSEASDRSSFEALQESLLSFISERSEDNQREVVVMGESFGALLAIATYLKSKFPLTSSSATDMGSAASPISRLVLLNPATGYDKTAWPLVAPLLERIPEAVYPALAAALLTSTAADSYQITSVTASLVSNPSNVPEYLSTFMKLCEAVPPATLGHRLKNWLSQSKTIGNKLGEVTVPTLVVCGEDDRLLKSSQEAKRLARALPQADVVVLGGVGHAVMDDRHSIAARIQTWVNDNPKADTVTRFTPPTPQQLRQAETSRGGVPVLGGGSLSDTRKATSPVFISTASDGRLVRGLGAIPRFKDRPVLFVGNHQLYAMDLPILIQQFLRERDEIIRGLSHPAIWQQGGQRGGGGKITRVDKNGVETGSNMFQTFGAVPSSGKNLYKLMQTGQHGLLFPGGVKEAYHQDGEQYSLFWPDRAEFVRTCARFDAIIVPFGAVGAYDSVMWVADSKQVLKAPVVGPWLEKQVASVPTVRDDETFIPPLALPRPEGFDRFYYLFGKPVDTRGVDADDRECMQHLYRQIKGDVQTSINVLLDARRRDPFRSPIRRRIFEKASGSQAPTFNMTSIRVPSNP